MRTAADWKKYAILWGIALALVLTSGCGGGRSNVGHNNNAPVITGQPANQTVMAGQTATFSVIASGNNLSYQWYRNQSAVASSSASYTTVATTAANNQDKYYVIVTNGAGSVQSTTATLTVNSQTLTITPSPLPNGTVSTPYSTTLGATGGTAPYTWTISQGTLPTGLQLTGTQISGTPSAVGTFNFTVTVADSSSPAQTDSHQYSVAITASSSQLQITNLTLPAGTENIAYDAVLLVTGGVQPYHWTFTGALPTGLSLNVDGTVSGVPGSPGHFTPTITVTDSSQPALTASGQLDLTIAPASASIITNPTNQTVLEGDQAVFTAAVNGRPPITIQWQEIANGTTTAVGSSITAGPGSYSYTTPATSFSTDNGTQYFISVTDADGVSAASVAATLTVKKTEQIAFLSNHGPDPATDAAGSQFNIWVMNYDHGGATGLKQLTHQDVAGSGINEFAWSPDGSRIVFTSPGKTDLSDSASANGTINIFAMNADGTGGTALTALTGSGVYNSNPGWSPDGSHIAFLSDRNLDGHTDSVDPHGHRNIWLMDVHYNSSGPTASVTNLRALTQLQNADAVSEDESLAWSPDGNQIAVISDRDLDPTVDRFAGTRNVWVIDVHTGAATPVTRDNGVNGGGLDLENHQPSWSPDSQTIVFTSDRDLGSTPNTFGALNVWVVHKDGTSAQAVTQFLTSGVAAYKPRFSADGTQLTFFSSASIGSSTTMNPDLNIWFSGVGAAGALRPLTIVTANTAGDSANPAWAPAWFPLPTSRGTGILFESTAIDPSASDGGSGAGTNNLWVIDSAGTSITPLTSYLHADAKAGAWQP